MKPTTILTDGITQMTYAKWIKKDGVRAINYRISLGILKVLKIKEEN